MKFGGKDFATSGKLILTIKAYLEPCWISSMSFANYTKCKFFIISGRFKLCRKGDPSGQCIRMNPYNTGGFFFYQRRH